MSMIRIVFLAAAGLLGMLSGNREAAAAGACQAFYDSTVPVPAGWAAAYDLFHAAHTTLATVDCSVGTTPVSIGAANDPTVYVYQTAYLLTTDVGAVFTPVTLSASQPAVNGWLPLPATAPLNLTSGQLSAGWNFVQFITARWNGTKWLIGCADPVCSTSAWSLQAITRQTTLTAKITPVAPSIADDTALGTTVATVSCAWSDASPCTATFSITDPAGIYKLSGSNIIVDTLGPGVGAAGTSNTIAVTATQ
jgi:hypothetical protein